ncbi:MAG TPA: hypothetical protein PKH72_07890 [Rhodoferax sp.]|jgi:hypothetical protein|nr:hypothetical protein [Rhodoferax sp.]HNV59561.1 hypothetical protein [Rhodoferax sp.]HPW29296.1 hypothetical protein [Rhodoferax sp.]
MDVNSVKRPVVQPAAPAKRPDPQQQAQKSEQAQKVADAATKTQESKPKPVMNSQGQMTGQRLNVTA